MSDHPALSRQDAAAIGQAVNKPASTIYRWRKDNPELFQAVREYAQRLEQAAAPTADKAYWEGRRAAEDGAGISDCPYTQVMSMTRRDTELADSWIAGLRDALSHDESPADPA